jgi:hypothetical protein
LAGKFGDGVSAEEFGSAAFGGGFFGDGFDAVFAIFVERAVAVGIGPGAAGTIDAVELIEMGKRGDAVDNAGFFEDEIGGSENGGDSAGDVSGSSDTRRSGFDGRLRVGDGTCERTGAVAGDERAVRQLGFPHSPHGEMISPRRVEGKRLFAGLHCRGTRFQNSDF